MSLPVIGLTVYRALNRQGSPILSIGESYVRAVQQAGACPVLIPLGLPEASLDALLPRLDGVIFTGGGDLHPELYGSTDHPLVDDVDTDRDRVEIHLFKQTLQAGTPFMGICRGLQLINVAMGGTLYEDILDQRSGALHHQHNDLQPRNYLAHPVSIQTGSRLHGILGSPQTHVNSLHHQGIRELAPGLQATAFAPDGLIEAFELADHPFGLAVQWHPEWLQEHAEMRALFAAFVQAAGQRN